MAELVEDNSEGAVSVALLVNAAGAILGGKLVMPHRSLPPSKRNLAAVLKPTGDASFDEWWAETKQEAAVADCRAGVLLHSTTGEYLPVMVNVCSIPGRDEYLVSYFQDSQPSLIFLDVLHRLYVLSQQVTSQLNSPAMLDMVVHTLHEIFQCRACVIVLRDETKPNELVIQAAVGIKDHWQKIIRWQVGEGIAGQVVATGQSFMSDDIHAEHGSLIFDSEVHSLIAVPVVFQGRVMGSLNLDSTQKAAFTPEHERILSIAAAQVAAALENARLYREEAARAKKLADLNEALNNQEGLREELIQNLSHELRTPLTYIKGYVSLLLDGDLGALDTEQINALRIVADKTLAVQRLISDVVQLEDIDADTLTIELLNINDLVQRSFVAIQQIYRDSEVSFRLILADEVGMVIGDRSRLSQAIDNLLMNAIKYSLAEAVVTVETRSDRAAQTVAIRVTDTGIGIDEAHQERIFDRFYRVKDPTSSNVSGSGIGLAIVRRIVDAHDGRIAVQSVKGEGSTFTIVLPAVDGAAPDG